MLGRAGYSCHYGGKVHWPVGLTPERLGFNMFCKDERERLAVETADLIRQRATHRGQPYDAPWLIVSSLINPHDICYHALRAHALSGGAADPTVGKRSAPDAATGAGAQAARGRAKMQGIFERGAPQIQELAALDEALLPPKDVDHETFLRDHLPPLPPNHAPQRSEPEQLKRFLDERPFQRWAREEWTETEWRLHRWAYARLMERVDKQIGVLLDALDSSGQADDTLVIFTSDQ